MLSSPPERLWACQEDIKTFPAEWEEVLNNPTKTKKPVDLENISEGNRHTSFLSLTGKLHRAGLNVSEIIQILMPMANSTGFGSELIALVNDVVARYPIERREKIRPESMQALLTEADPPLEWMIEGLWTDKSRGFIAGHPGVGKTWIALEMLISVATGGLCMGKYKAAYAAPCLIVEEEASRRNLQRRIHALARARGLEPSALSKLFHITRQFLNIPKDCNELIEIVRTNGIKFVVFDSLREVHTSKENSSDEMAVVLKSFSQLSILGDCSVLLIHHLAKSSIDNASKSIFERMRGTGSLWAWRDCILGVEGEENAEVCSCSFQFRDADSPAPIQIKRHVGEMSGAIALEALALEETEDFISSSTEIVDYLKSQIAGASKNQICKAVEGRKKEILTVIKRMEKRGMLAKMDGKIVVPEFHGTNGNHGNQ